MEQDDKAERAIILNKVADVIEENAEHFALLETLDNGKPIRETRAIDVAYSVDHFRYFAGVLLGRHRRGRHAPRQHDVACAARAHRRGGADRSVELPVPHGRVEAAPVLAAGDCTVFKPSSTTSLTVLELGAAHPGHHPGGRVQRGDGPGQQVRPVHPGQPRASPSWPSPAPPRSGATWRARRPSGLIPATLELGGKSANIIFPDAKWDMVMDGVQLGILFNQGQVCCAGSRIFVHEDVYDKFVADACEAFGKVKVGMPWRTTPRWAARSMSAQAEKILEYVEIAKQEAGACCAAASATSRASAPRARF